MNQHLHRLVFSRRHGMLLAVSESARACGKAAGGEGRAGSAVLLLVAALAAAASPATAQTAARPPVVFASQRPAPANPLPVPYSRGDRSFVYDPAKGDARRGGSSADLAANGSVGWSVQGTTATFNQGQVNRVVINWDRFDIAAGYSVHFAQNKDPSQYVSALNRIWSADPSLILGSLTADREVILLNANGVYFGRGARVDTGKFIASSLGLADSVFEKGLRNVTDGSAVFATDAADSDPTNLDNGISVEAGAEIRSAAGGDVLLIAPRVVNQGRIETPGGQAVLAAGSKVYLMSSSDPAQRGLIVAVDPVTVNGAIDPGLGIAENDATGTYKTVNGQTVADSTPDNTSGLVTRINEIQADRGSVNLVGLTVRQNGNINATTAVKGANGAIYLQAMASTTVLQSGSPGQSGTAAARGLAIDPGAQVHVGADLGTVEIGAASVTAVMPDSGGATQLDAEVFNPSRIRIEGRQIGVAGGASITAPSGRIELLAASNTLANPLFDSTIAVPLAADDSLIGIAPGARISAAGLSDVAVDGARNQGSLRLFRIELADAPVQRSGPLYRSQAYFDLRNGSRITAADVTGAAAAVARTAAEKSTAGGSVSLQADGAVVLGAGAQVDVSGGSVHYSQTVLQSSLVERNGHLIAFSDAAAGNRIDSLLATPQRSVTPAYTEGAAGGALTIAGHQVALAGAELQGQVTQGERQRDGTDPRAAGARLALGTGTGLGSFPLATISIDANAVSPVDPGWFADPTPASLAAVPSTTSLALSQVEHGGFGALLLRASAIVQPNAGALDLGVGGRLDLLAGTLQLDGTYRAAGGSLTLQTATGNVLAGTDGAGDIALSSSTRLDAAGLWTNDTAGAGSAAAAGPVQVDGGTVTVNAAHSLTLAPGAAVDVSAGAWLQASGRVKTGGAGSIALGIAPATYTQAGGELALAGASLAGFDFAGGGTLTLGTPALTIAGAGATAPGFTLAPDFFSSQGFGRITVRADGDVRLLSGTTVAPQLLNWVLAPGYASAPSGAFGAAVAAAQAIDPRLATPAPVDLTLNASQDLNLGANASVVVERGAAITLAPGGALTLSATRNVEVGASGGSAGQHSSLTARGGRITLAIVGPRGDDTQPQNDPLGFLADQAIWLGNDAQLSVAGIAQLRPEGGSTLVSTGAVADATPIAGRSTGQVLGGGRITLAAQRGYVIAEAGSTMNLDGASASLNLPGLAAAVGVARPAGTLTVSTPEGFALDGAVSAQAPRDAGGAALADGGRLDLSVALGGNATGVAASVAGGQFIPAGYLDDPALGAARRPRTVSVGNHDGLLAATGATLGQDLAQRIGNGIGYVRTSLLASAGFDALALGAGDSVRFDSPLTLTLPLGLQLNAPAVAAAPGVQVDLTSAYAQLGDLVNGRSGNFNPDRAAHADASAGGGTTLALHAPTIELYGSWGLQGFASVLFDAGALPGGEIRLGAVAPGVPATTLGFAGRLELAAGEVYATSGSQVALAGLPAASADDTGSTLRVSTGAGGATATPPLSAFGALDVTATQIEQDGVLRQPFGSISLGAERTLTLGDGSVTSVSGAGATVPYGTTENLTLWQPPAGATNTLPVAKGVTLSGQQVLTSSRARVDASGGGTVQASEFFPGVGGSRDVFDTPGLYAVLPDYAATQALALNGGRLDPSQQGLQIVITSAGSGLAPGRYTLLPARYALIGGALPQAAFLVSRATDQGSSVLTRAVPQDDGSSIVAGYLTQAGSVNVGVPGERFVVEPLATAQARSDIRLTDVSALLAGRAATLGTATPLLPRDGGQLQVSVAGQDTGGWQAQTALGADGGLAGLFDLSATRLALVDDLGKTPAGSFGIAASVISNSGAGSVLLGGRRSLTSAAAGSQAPVWTIDQGGTSAVDVDLGSQALQVEELLLAATDRVTLAAGTQIGAASSATLGARTLASSGDGALLAVSANALTLQRSAAALAGGDLSVGAGSVLAGRQVSLDASGRLQVDGTAGLQAQALSLGAGHLVIGDGAAADPAASIVAGGLLNSVRATRDITLQSYRSLDFVGVQDWAQRSGDTPGAVASRLLLDAPLLRGVDAADGTPAQADIAAASVTLRNSSGASADPAASGQGTLQLQALPPLQYGSTGGLTLGPGALSLGFDSATLRSGGDIVLQGNGSLQAQGDLTLSAARLTASTGATQTLAAAGTLRLRNEAGSRTLGESVGFGADVTLAARTLVQQGVIDLPGAQLALQASGSDSGSAAIVFDAGSTTSVAGRDIGSAAGFVGSTPAGSLVARAAQGGIELLGTLDASAAGSGDGGAITLAAAGAGGQVVLAQGGSSGQLLARAGSAAGDLGGRLDVDVASMPSADALAQQSTAGGFGAGFALRVRTGDVTLDSGVSAEHIGISADSGSLLLGNTRLDAVSAAGGVVQLAAGADLRLGSGTQIDARSLRSGANGGDVLLASAAGRVHLDAGARVDARGDAAQDGRIVLRAQQGADQASVAVDPLASAQLLGGEVDIEAVRTYSGVSSIAAGNGGGSTLGQATVVADATAFMASAGAVLGALGVGAADAGRVHLRAGVEVQSAGDLTLGGDWALNAARPGGDAGFLTLRAAGNLLVNGSLSDGFNGTTASALLGSDASAWSYRLVAGADLGAANPLAVNEASAAASGDLTVAAGRLVRTGAGSIEMAAGRDIVFATGVGSTPGGSAYVAGRAAADQAAVLASLFAGQPVKPLLTAQGGRLELDAGRDVVSGEARQLVNNWLWRTGIVSGDSYANSSQLAWWTQFSRFQQTLGSFGGGNLVVNAGRDVVNLQAMVPTQGFADSQTLADATLQVRNGGDLAVSAGRDLRGGQFLLGSGQGRLRAGGEIGAAGTNLRVQDPLLALLDGRWDVVARGDLALGGLFDPTAVSVSSSDSRYNVSNYFYSWGGDAGLTLQSSAGAVHMADAISNSSVPIAYGLNSQLNSNQLFQVLPASLRITAASGDVRLFDTGQADAVLFPSVQGALEVWSGGDLLLGSRLAMADSALSLWPDFTRPVRAAQPGSLFGDPGSSLLGITLANSVPSASLHANDGNPARLHAEGSIQAAPGLATTLVLPKPGEITAGLDILGLQLSGQNLAAGDTTIVSAGRNLLAGLIGSIGLAGPGALEISAGRQVDLESSAGIRTTGNVNNAALPAQGASVSLTAAAAGTLDLAALDARYLQIRGSAASPRAQQYRDLLLASVRAALKQPALDYDQAWALFQTFPPGAQAAFGRQVLAAEFGAVYLTAPAPTVAQMTATLQAAFDQHKSDILQAGAAALAAGTALTLPGGEALQGSALSSYLAGLRALPFASIDIGSAVAARVASLAQVRQGWRDTVAASLGGSAAGFDALLQQDPQAPAAQAWQAALQDFSGAPFQRYRQQVLQSEVASAGAAASQYGRNTLPLRQALFDQGFQVAELAGAGSFAAQPLWSGAAPLMAYTGSLDMTQSGIVTERGGAIGLVNAGGAINVGLKQDSASSNAVGVIALGGGDIFGFAKGDFQVNTQRVFVVGSGDMTIWSSAGNIDSGRGANTAVAAPPLVAQRGADGVAFVVPATTTGSGLGILEDASGRSSGTIGLYPAFGEILALDAFIRAPAIVLGSTIKGADNLQAASVGGAVVAVAAPPVAVAPPASADSRAADAAAATSGVDSRPRNSLLTVELLGLGPADGSAPCSEEDERAKKCRPPAAACSDAQRAAGACP